MNFEILHSIYSNTNKIVHFIKIVYFWIKVVIFHCCKYIVSEFYFYFSESC